MKEYIVTKHIKDPDGNTIGKRRFTIPQETVNEIRADERRKCGEELLNVIEYKPFGTEKYDLWLLSQIKHICFGILRICDEKEQKNEI